MMKNKIKINRYFLFIATFLLVYEVASVLVLNSWMMPHTTVVFHLVDFSMGFCSRILPGAIYNFLFDNNSVELISLYNFILHILFLFGLAFISSVFIEKAEKENKLFWFIVLFFFFTGPTVFSMYNFERGTMDHYWAYFTLLSVFFLSSKYCYGLIVLTSLLCVMTNVGSMVTYIPFIVLLMIYKTTVINDKKDKALLWVAIVLTVLSSAALTVYFLINEQSNLTYTFDEFNQILNSRGYTGISPYYASNFYYNDFFTTDGESLLAYTGNTFSDLMKELLFRISVTFEDFSIWDTIFPLLLALPLIIAIFIFFIDAFKKKTNIVKKFVFLGIITMFIVTLFAGLIFSTDTGRFIGHAFTLLFASMLYVIWSENEYEVEKIRLIVTGIPTNFIILYGICYSTVLLNPVG